MLERKKSPRRLLHRFGIRLETFANEGKFADEVGELAESCFFVSDKGFAGSYLERVCGIECFFRIEREDLENVKIGRRLLRSSKKEVVCGFGGGRALDVAKRIATEEGKSLLLIPTAPSHNGIISPTASLWKGGKKVSLYCKYPERVIVPFHLWKKATRHQKAGRLDAIGSVTAIHDVFLAKKLIGERVRRKSLRLSLTGIHFACKKGEKNLMNALLLGGVAMEESSRYCSGSEHEVEKPLSRIFPQYFHGELVGVGFLVSSYVYQSYLPESLTFESVFSNSQIFEKLVRLVKLLDLNDVLLRILNDGKFKEEFLKLMPKIHRVRPERFTLWNLLPRLKVDWREVYSGVESSLP